MLELLDVAPAVKARLRNIAVQRGLLMQEEAVKAEVVKYCNWTPTPKQRELIGCNAVECLYGGAVGGGKTAGEVIDGLQYAHMPNYTALYLREQYSELTKAGGVLSVFETILRGTRAAWNGQSKQWRFPEGGIIDFGGLRNKRDQDKFRGPAWTRIYWDDAGNADPKNLVYIKQRMRKAAECEVPTRYTLTANPGGRSHDHLKARYVVSKTRERAFIKALLSDNPHLDREDYLKTLEDYDETTKQQLINGDWDVVIPGLFLRNEHLPELGPTEIPMMDCYVRGFDPSMTGDDDDAGTALLTRDGIEHYCLHAEAKPIPITEFAAWMKFYVDRDPPGTIYALEKSSYGLTAIQMLMKEDACLIVKQQDEAADAWMEGAAMSLKTGKFPIVIVLVPQVGSKAARASAHLTLAKKGHFHLRRGTWCKAYRAEHVRFSNDKKDTDAMIDATSNARKVLAQLNPRRLNPKAA